MKKVLLALVFLLSVTVVSAQLPNGSVCPNWTGTDLEGNTWTLYDLLDEGYPVIIDVSAAWCAPCWGYHNTGALEDLYDMYGPEGTNELRVFYIEGEGTNTEDQLYGPAAMTGDYATQTQGDWVTGTPYPIIDDADIANDLQIAYFPTIYAICPSRLITEVGQATTEDIYEFVSQGNCQPASKAFDAALLGINAEGGTCENGDVEVEVTLQNFGTNEMTSATIVITGGANDVTYEWNGSLDTYELTTVNVGTIPMNGGGVLTATVTSNDGNPANSTLMVSAGVAESTTNIRVVIQLDNWPEETSWEIRNEDGDVVASVSEGDYDGMNEELVQEDVFVDGTGCYTFALIDAYGDGLHGAQWGFSDGSCVVYGLDSDGNAMFPIMDYNGSYDFDALERDANVTEVVSVENVRVATGLNVYPNPTNGVLNLNYSIAGEARMSVEIVDMVGAVVLVQNIGTVHTGSYTNQVDMSALAAGLYMVNVRTNDVVDTFRVTVSK